MSPPRDCSSDPDPDPDQGSGQLTTELVQETFELCSEARVAIDDLRRQITHLRDELVDEVSHHHQRTTHAVQAQAQASSARDLERRGEMSDLLAAAVSAIESRLTLVVLVANVVTSLVVVTAVVQLR
jgi:hypothetical protein